ncbi:hypothetical protein [Chryseobacterium sp.]|uniref:hypothetical protein n=1 Tax=Chryseobacterium sp. TaxID=1871047 RepID=UPI002637037E|nr:hypothetical protein [Chryseobacterium sp.]
MPFDRSILTEKLKKRASDFFISKREITEVIFNRDEIVFTLIKVQKMDIPDFTSFIIAAMGASGSDEWEMQNSEILMTDQEKMLQQITDFQHSWKLNLAIETYIEGEIQYIYEMMIDPEKPRHDSEISFVVETDRSFIYFFTHHFYY